jgi:NADP-dependent 3-hydroxy acid dehydrogenase YdfG
VRVVAVSRTETDELLALKSEYPTSLVVCKGDVAKDEDNKSAVDVAIKSFDRLDALIRESLSFGPTPLADELDSQRWDTLPPR